MPAESQRGESLLQFVRLVCVLALAVLPACESALPSARLQQEVTLPVPVSAKQAPDPARLTRQDRGETQRLSPRTLIPLAFNLQPDIKSEFDRFKSEEARYDFFYTSRDALTPRFNVGNVLGESRADEGVTRDREHVAELGVEKLFFDTTEADVAVGYRSAATDQAIGDHPFLSASLRYPLWVSRRKLERTSEDIFRRNELNDAQLDYIEEVRSRLEGALFKFYEVMGLERELKHLERWNSDLESLARRIDEIEDRDVSTDRRRVAAEITRVGAEFRKQTGWYEIQLARLKSHCGLPFHVRLEMVDEPFNPFEGAAHEELFQASIATDPEIATLRNALRNAEVQLDLARRGKWDVTLMLNGESGLEGRGEDEGVSDWSVSAGVEVSAVDRRVTESLERQAQANIHRFVQAIAARENSIFVDTLEPVVRIETLSASRDELIANLPRYQDDYDTGLAEYLASRLAIDDLLSRRETLFGQEEEISGLTSLVGYNVAELCSATGRFFELLDGPIEEEDG
ncbi:MAG TPA: TolC family protein [Phycisphaerae bacterium]|nr:TolC family protein [Phycisphaerae bacterium]